MADTIMVKEDCTDAAVQEFLTRLIGTETENRYLKIGDAEFERIAEKRELYYTAPEGGSDVLDSDGNVVYAKEDVNRNIKLCLMYFIQEAVCSDQIEDAKGPAFRDKDIVTDKWEIKAKRNYLKYNQQLKKISDRMFTGETSVKTTVSAQSFRMIRG